jgi:two-component system, OmpR family, sensor histidine kinase VicK
MPDSTQTITEEIYKRNRELLHERRRAEQLLFNVSEGVFAVDKDFKITIFNDTISEMLNIPGGVANGKSMDEVIKVETEKGAPVDLKQYCFLPPEKMPVLHDVVLKAAPKDFFVNVKFSPIQSETNADESECLITISDITKEVMLDKAKDDFLSLASHELRTPMTIIKGYLWMLQNNQVGELNAEQRNYIEIAFRSTETMIAMISDMLNISRMEQGKLTFNLKPGKIVTTIQDALTGFEINAKEKNIYFKVDLTQVPLDLDAYYDDGKLKECIINLVGNAIKFTKEGGVTVSAEQTDTHVKISMIDTGAGISDDEKPKLFQKFGKGDSSYTRIAETGGTGLGLFIVKLYIEAMGGQVGYISEGEFKGSTFWITVPTSTQIHR